MRMTKGAKMWRAQSGSGSLLNYLHCSELTKLDKFCEKKVFIDGKCARHFYKQGGDKK